MPLVLRLFILPPLASLCGLSGVKTAEMSEAEYLSAVVQPQLLTHSRHLTFPTLEILRWLTHTHTLALLSL